MNIAMVGPFPPPVGGMAQHISQLCQNLRQKGMEIQVVDTNYRNINFLSNKKKIFIIFFKKLFCYIKAIGILRKTKCDLVHAHLGSYKSFWAGTVLLFLSGSFSAKTVATIHGGAFPEFINSESLWFKKYLLKFFLNKFSRIIAVNDTIKNVIVAIGIDEHKINVMIPFWGIPQCNQVILPHFISEFMASKPIIFSSVIFLEPKYNSDVLVDGFAKFATEFIKIGLIIVGSGSGEQQLSQKISGIGLEDRILLAGNLTHHQCIEIIKNSSCFIRPPLVDGDSISVREALDLGIPVVASNTNFRPDGVVLFDKYDPKDLAYKLKLITQQGNQAQVETSIVTKESHKKTRGDIEKIIHIYRSI